MRSILKAAVLGSTVLFATAAAAQEPGRIALLIGNQNYARNVGVLQNPHNDVGLLEKALTGLKFKVTTLRDAGYREMDTAIKRHVSEVRRAGGGAISFFYYSGHGIANPDTQINYLIPTDVTDANSASLWHVSFEQSDIIDKLSRQAPGATHYVVFDACRNELRLSSAGMKTLGAEKGFIPVVQTAGLLIAYSTAPKQTASDVGQGGGPYARALADEITKPGVEAVTMFRNVQLRVKQTIGQDPWLTFPSLPPVYLAGQSVQAPQSDAERVWLFLKDNNNPAVFESFIKKFGDSPFGDGARARLEELRRAERQNKQQVAVAVPPPPQPSPARQPGKQQVAVAVPPPSPARQPGKTIKVGILHSLSGTMAVSETTLKDVLLMLIEEQNRKGGLLGRKLDAVVVDPASNWPLFAEKARELVAQHKVDVTFGTWTSVSRKSVLPIFRELNSLLFFPVQYEGEESERNVFYTGAAPNQQAIPAIYYLMSKDGGAVQRWVLAGTDFVYPRTTNKILVAYLKQKGVKAEDIMINYTPFGHSDWSTIVADIKRFGSAGKKTAVLSTISGDANIPFYAELSKQGITAKHIPVMAFSVGEEELAGIDTRTLVGHLAAWNYFQSVDTPANRDFITRWRAFTGNSKRVTNDPMEAHVIGFNMWVKAVERAGTSDADKVIDAIVGVEVPNLTGGMAQMLPNHHITKPVMIGEIRADGQFDVVWNSVGVVPGDAWSKYLEGSKDLIADWTKPISCGSYNTRIGKCQ